MRWVRKQTHRQKKKKKREGRPAIDCVLLFCGEVDKTYSGECRNTVGEEQQSTRKKERELRGKDLGPKTYERPHTRTQAV